MQTSEHKTKNTRDKIIIMGAGAVGGYFGALMSRAGQDVVFVARGHHLKAMREKGLMIKNVNGDFHITRLNATDNPASVSSPHLIIIAVKSYSTREAISAITPCIGKDTLVMSIQNGISNYPKLIKEFGEEKVIPGFTKIAVEIESPGVIKHSGKGEIWFGEPDGKESKRIASVKAIFERGKVPYVVSTSIIKEIWKKFIWNSVFNIITAITRVTGDVVMNTEETYATVLGAIDELVLLAEVEGIVITEEDKKDILNLARNLGVFRTSTYNDVLAHKQLETEAFTGEALRLAKKHGLPMPVNTTLYGLIKAVESKG